MLGSPVNILNVEIRGQFIHFIFLFYGIGINIFLILGMHALWRFHNVSLVVLSASKRLELLAMLFILLCDWTRKPTTTETSTKLICLSFPNLVNSITFKLSKELSVVYFLSQLPKHYQEYENRIVVFINPDTSQLKSNSISIWTSKLPFPSIKTLSNIELGKSFKNKLT